MDTDIPAEKRQAKLKLVVELEGYPGLDELLRDASIDSLCPSICMNEGCDYTAQYEGDQREGCPSQPRTANRRVATPLHPQVAAFGPDTSLHPC